MQGKDTVTREQIIKWYRLSEMDDLLTESRIAMLGDFAIFARAALATTDAIAPTEGAVCLGCNSNWPLHDMDCPVTVAARSAPSPEAPAVDALTTGAVGEVKQKQSHVWLEIYGRNLSDLVGAKLYFAHPASAPKVTTGAVAWEYRNQYGDPFLTHKDPDKWHPHDKAGFKDFRALGYVANPASEPKALTDRYVQRYNEYSGEGGGVCENDEGETP